MDVYETFYAYNKNGTTPSLRGQKDTYIKEIVKLMKDSGRTKQTFVLHKRDARPFSDHLFYPKSHQRIDGFAKYLGARVSMEWVKACASKVDPPGSIQLNMLDKTSDRHIHIIEPDISIFLKLLQTNPKVTMTYSRTEGAAYAIHLPILYKKLSQICTNHPVLWFMIACSIGIPTHNMYTPQTFLCKWKKEPNRKLLNNDNIILTILRPIFQEPGPKETEIVRLLRKFHDMESDFKNTETVLSVNDYMFRRIYAYPTADEIEHLFDRVRLNLSYSAPTLVLKERNKTPRSPSKQTKIRRVPLPPSIEESKTNHKKTTPKKHSLESMMI
jgi:hypothetical protein